MKFVYLNDSLVNLDNVEMIDIRDVGDKISVSIFFTSGENKHFVLDKSKEEFIVDIINKK